ncbi:MAG: hypothetical protein HW388_1445 [Dehalococcoidia bacterium]|nr:hypothetical protein [Dehalococcoidia bacterium]
MAEMNENKRSKSRSRVKQKAFQDKNISLLPEHHRESKRLTPPFGMLEGLQLSSWPNDRLSGVVGLASEEVDQGDDKKFVTHSALARLPKTSFDAVMRPVLEDDECKRVLCALMLVDTLPDRAHWARHLERPEEESGFELIGNGIVANWNHQSEQATDCRWLKYAYLIAVGRIRFPKEMIEEVKDVMEYPNRGDQRHVRPSIRAGEGAIASLMVEEGLEPWAEAFWDECWNKTRCVLGGRASDSTSRPSDAQDAFQRLYESIVDHFMRTCNGTMVDPKHDGAFGLALFCIYLGLAAFNGAIGLRVEGRLILRSMVEVVITLKFLAYRDEALLWAQYRNYGVGQSKLAFLKNLTQESLPQFLSLEDLERYANEDYWQEYQSIDLGSWAGTSVYKMSQECGEKELYDQIYDWTSAYVHGNWGAVRDTIFDLCLNPLHRLHRIPSVPRMNMPNVLSDVQRLVNQALDILNKLYPGLDSRLKLIS